MYDQVKTSPVICDNNANFCQRAHEDSVKIQSRSGLSFLFSPPRSGLTPSAYWRFDFFHIFFPREVTQACGVKDGERYVCHEAREHVSPQPANSSSNTHRPVDGCKPGWLLGRLNSIRSATQTVTVSCLLASVRATKNSPRFLTIFCT